METSPRPLASALRMNFASPFFYLFPQTLTRRALRVLGLTCRTAELSMAALVWPEGDALHCDPCLFALQSALAGGGRGRLARW